MDFAGVALPTFQGISKDRNVASQQITRSASRYQGQHQQGDVQCPIEGYLPKQMILPSRVDRNIFSFAPPVQSQVGSDSVFKRFSISPVSILTDRSKAAILSVHHLI